MTHLERRDRCILCQAPAGASMPEVVGYRICRACDVAWCAIEDPIDATKDWDRHYYADSAVFELHERRVSGLQAIARRLSEVCPERGHLLDVGAGLGLFMEAAARLGWSVEGVEPSGVAADFARKLTGAPVHRGLLEDLDLPKEAYDAVTFFDALRTVPDPLTFLRSARELLRPGGVLVIREIHRKVELGLRWIQATLRRHKAPPGRSAFEYRQCFSPRSLLFAYRAVGLTAAWVEPSPVFEEPDSGASRTVSLMKLSAGQFSAALYRLSGCRLILGPNLLAFGRAPGP